MNVRLLFAAIAFPALTAPAAAQTSWVEIDDKVIVAPFDQPADTVDDWDVYTSDGTKIGEVDEVLGRDATAASALAIDFEGTNGFEDRDVVVPLDQFSWTDSRLVISATPDAVKAMERYND